MLYISIKKYKQHKKHILESVTNIKFICKLYLIAIYSLVNYQWMNSSWFYFMFSYYTSMKLVQRDFFTQNYAMQVIWIICKFN